MAMTFPLVARWTERDVVQEKSVQDVDSALALFNRVDAASRSRPTMVEFDDLDGGAIAVGAGRDVTVVTAQDSEDPPYFTSLAKRAVTNGDVMFLYAGENTPYPGHSIIPRADGVRALERFLRTGELDPDLDWERL
jgi:hypothetical protein